MILIGKCKKDFELYLSQEYGKFETTTFQECASAPQYPIFLDEINLPESIKNALIIEFFDSVGIYIEIRINNNNPLNKGFHGYVIKSINGYYKCTTIPVETREEATNQAIIKANEIYNERKI